MAQAERAEQNNFLRGLVNGSALSLLIWAVVLWWIFW
jgi:hypothetical protein